ncbi:MAG: hypothetical protein RJA10_2863 [Pseudomonadota bacterium]
MSIELLERRLARERAARLEAEGLLESKARELYDTNVALQRLIVELDDVVAQRTAEALAARDEAVAASKAKSAFLANMSHEIRTPLASIIGFAELLMDDDLRVSRGEALRTIVNNGHHLLQIVSDILDVSKIEAESLEIDAVDTNLPALLNDTERLMGPRAREKGLEFVVEAVLPLPGWLLVDDVRLKQVLINFCSNAVKFTAQGSIKLRVTADAATQRLSLSVIDTGIGLTPEQSARLFQPFTQADSSTTRQFGGTGLGLYICHQLAQLMGGEVSVQSVPGQGSCFMLQLPLAAGGGEGWIDDPARWQRVGRLDQPAAAQVPQLQGRVLLAEDGEHNQRLIAALVEGTGATLEIVDNGEAAVQQALAGDHDLVLMDIQMPVMDGVTAVQLLRGAGYGGPIVALTANVMRQDVEAYRATGCNDVLAKPIDRARLYGVLSLHLRAGSGGAQASARDDQLAAVVDRLARSFRQQLPDTIGQLQQALGGRRWSDLGQQAHRIKGLAGSIGFPELTALAEPVETAVRAGNFDDAAAHGLRLVAGLQHTLATPEAPA